MQIPIQFYWKRFKETFPYIVIAFLLICLFFQRETYSDELKQIKKEKEVILSQNKELNKANVQLTHFIDESLSEREKVIEKHYHTKEVINNKIIENEKNINRTVSDDELYKFLTEYRYNPFYGTIKRN